jgi:hypothetical protein
VKFWRLKVTQQCTVSCPGLPEQCSSTGLSSGVSRLQKRYVTQHASRGRNRNIPSGPTELSLNLISKAEASLLISALANPRRDRVASRCPDARDLENMFFPRPLDDAIPQQKLRLHKETGSSRKRGVRGPHAIRHLIMHDHPWLPNPPAASRLQSATALHSQATWVYRANRVHACPHAVEAEGCTLFTSRL